jgi:GAF domain-containing protein
VIDQRRLHHAPVGTEESLLEHAERVNQVRLVSQLTVPLLRGDRTLGALVVLTPERREFSREEQELLKTFARTAALAIDNARLYEEAQEALRAAKMADPR